MNNLPYLKSFCRSVLLIGFAGTSAMTSSIQAADIGMAVLKDAPVQRSAKSESMTSGNNATPLQGAQGPIRTEKFSDLKPTVDAEMVRRDLELQRYPISSNAAIP